MKIVFLGQHDWGNACNRITRAINSRGKSMTARIITECLHPFRYQEDIVLERDGDDAAKAVFYDADWIISIAGYEHFDRLTHRLGTTDQKKLATLHAGSAYRSNPEGYNQEDKRRGFLRRFLGCDLYRFAISDPTACIFIALADEIDEEVAELSDPLRVCHTSSNRRNKGTAFICEVVPEISVIENVSYHECQRLRRLHQVLVDQFVPAIGGYGAVALEALASGMAVISNTNKVTPLVDQWIPRPPILEARSANDIRTHLTRLENDPDFLSHTRHKSLAWAQHYLSAPFTYQYWEESLTI